MITSKYSTLTDFIWQVFRSGANSSLIQRDPKSQNRRYSLTLSGEHFAGRGLVNLYVTATMYKRLAKVQRYSFFLQFNSFSFSHSLHLSLHLRFKLLDI
jgi:hypothetical protein